jgi:hypothetical protein
MKIKPSFIFLAVMFFGVFGLSDGSYAAQTTGGVNFTDPLGYTKPAFYPISYPSEADCGGNVYYVDRLSGSGTSCTHDQPCAWTALSGKPGMAGGPARIYLKGGTQNMTITSGMYGSAGNEIVILPWPDSSADVVFSSGGTYGNRIGGATAHHIIFDGGPKMQFVFNSVGGSGETNYNVTTAGDYITFYRCRFDNNANSGPVIGPAVGSGTYTNYNYFINCEIYDAMNLYGVYTGGGTACSAGDTGHNYLYFINNIFRDICGRGIQIEPRDYSDHTYVIGNAFHNIGYGCSNLNQVSSCVQPATACGGINSYLYVYNNIAWDLGGGFFYINGSASNAFAWNNTVYDYAKSPRTAQTQSHAFSCDSGPMTARGNIALRSNAGGVVAFNRCSFTQSNNLCEDGTCTGYSGTQSSEFVSYDAASVDHLKLKAGATSIGHGYDMSEMFASSYFEDSRILPFDIGADEYVSGQIDMFAPASPGGLTVR